MRLKSTTTITLQKQTIKEHGMSVAENGFKSNNIRTMEDVRKSINDLLNDFENGVGGAEAILARLSAIEAIQIDFESRIAALEAV